MLNSERSLSRIALVPFVAALSMPVLAFPAAAHQAPKGWTYPWACCANQDCEEVQASAISERPNGYVVDQTGEVISYGDKRIKDSPDGEYHWCAHRAGIDAGHTICLFVPPKSF